MSRDLGETLTDLETVSVVLKPPDGQEDVFFTSGQNAHMRTDLLETVSIA